MAGLSMVDTGGLAAKEKATWKASREADRSTSRTTRLAAGISYRTWWSTRVGASVVLLDRLLVRLSYRLSSACTDEDQPATEHGL